MSNPFQEQYNLLLVGRTGNGKSSTGNAILGGQLFRLGHRSGDDVIEFNSAVVDGLTLQVVDGTGVGDTGNDAAGDIQTLLTHLSDTLWRYVLDINAVILVLQYGARFTKQEKDAVELIKSIFGRDVFKKWGVIVMTHGDNFELDNEDRGATFEDWIKEQTGDIQTLFKECENRCVLFNNRTKDEDKMRTQREKLVEKVQAIKCKPYTAKELQEEAEGHSKILVQSKISKLQCQANQIIDSITKRLANIQNRMTLHLSDCMEKLQSISRELDSLKLHVNQEDRGTGLVQPILLQINVAELSLDSSKRRCRQLLDQQGHTKPPPMRTVHTVTFSPAEEWHDVTRRVVRQSCHLSWSSKESLAFMGVVVIVVAVVTLVFASRYANF